MTPVDATSTSAGAQPSRAATASTSASASATPSGPVGHVGVLGHHDDRLRPPVGEVAPADRHARADEPAPREHPGGGDGPCVGGDHDEVVGVVLDADVGDMAAEPGRQGGHDARAARQRSSASSRCGRPEDPRHRRQVAPRRRGRSDVSAHALDVVGAAASRRASPRRSARRASPADRGRTAAARRARPHEPVEPAASAPLGDSCSRAARSHIRIAWSSASDRYTSTW